MKMQRPAASRFLAALLCCLGGCYTSIDGPQGGRETNWLTSCERDADCGEAACICGVCTSLCESDLSCSDAPLPTVCFTGTTPIYDALCEECEREQTPGICLPECGPGNACPADTTCTAGACVPDDSAALQSASFAQDFSRPVAPPQPEILIAGESVGSLLAGVWEQQLPAAVPLYQTALQLLIEPSAGGYSFQGTVSLACDGDACGATSTASDPIDPDTGYPPELSARDQNALRIELLPGHEYRMFDARLQGNRFSFWFSGNDLWRRWCALQTPYFLENRERSEYGCLPDPRPYQLDSAENIDGKELLCSADRSVCHCAEDGCTAGVHSAYRTLDLVLDGDSLKGAFCEGVHFLPISFARRAEPGVAAAIEPAGTVDQWRRYAPEPGIRADNAGRFPLGVWSGETRESITCSGSRRLSLTITETDDPLVAAGYLVLGETDPLPPATVASTVYPPGDDQADIDCRRYSPCEGFAYTLLGGRLSEDGRLQFRIAVLELYEKWCAMQGSYPGETGFFDHVCVPELSSQQKLACAASAYASEDVGCPLDTGMYALCSDSEPCICFADGCTANSNRTISFDLTVDGSSMAGLISDLSSGSSSPREVRLQRTR